MYLTCTVAIYLHCSSLSECALCFECCMKSNDQKIHIHNLMHIHMVKQDAQKPLVAVLRLRDENRNQYEPEL